MRKGFSPGKRIQWDVAVWEELYEILESLAPDGQFLWNNKILVHLYLKGQRDPWATVITKRTSSLDLILTGPKDSVTLGRLTSLARERELDNSRADRDTVKLGFRTVADLHKGDLSQFLQEHRDAADAASRRERKLSRPDMTEPLLAPTFLFHFSIPCPHRKRLWSKNGIQLEPKYRLPSFGELEGKASVRRVSSGVE